MVAYDSRRGPDPSQLLKQDTIDALLEALREQRAVGGAPRAALAEAIRVAATEARERALPPEALLIQLKGLADRVGIPAVEPERLHRQHVREWMVRALLEAYWQPPTDGA